MTPFQLEHGQRGALTHRAAHIGIEISKNSKSRYLLQWETASNVRALEPDMAVKIDEVAVERVTSGKYLIHIMGCLLRPAVP